MIFMNLLKTALFAALIGLSNLALAAININTASTTELETLNGVGAAKAKAIVEYREKHGPFKSVDQLAEVKGIGEKLVEKNRANLTTAAGK
ncbi:topoisomerase [Ahniella affigens]|uniref:Topoisomerase n=2 Tax=Ahniella affigens TaxID=2021234 RepID=A0A2P1PTZ3_9GAMM|nr:topoisomerase [Ahniella affigens]